MVSPSTTLVHIRIWGLEQEIDRHKREMKRIRTLDDFILGEFI
jgi:hypothetical protein